MVAAAMAPEIGTGDGSYERWKSALLSTLFISTLPNILLYLIPSKWLKRGKNDTLNIQHVLLCFAAGGLLGDVLLHSIPHLLSPHQHHDHHSLEVLSTHSHELHEEHEHDHHEHEHHEHEHEHDHHHHHEESHQRILQSDHGGDHEHHHEHLLHIGLLIIVGYMIFFVSERLLSQQFSSDPEKKKNDDHHSHAHTLTSNISVMGWLNIFADVMHNFTDGIAMGASYASGSSSHALGLAATISILFHEIPHEIGDFTILIESGVSKSQAIRMQFYTSIAAFLGTIVGLLTEGVGVWNEILLAVTSGGFIYVATSSLIPSVLNKTPENSPSSRYTQIILECLGFSIGVVSMYIVGLLE